YFRLVFSYLIIYFSYTHLGLCAHGSTTCIKERHNHILTLSITELELIFQTVLKYYIRNNRLICNQFICTIRICGESSETVRPCIKNDESKKYNDCQRYHLVFMFHDIHFLS